MNPEASLRPAFRRQPRIDGVQLASLPFFVLARRINRGAA
jgi:hypothetical protein